MEPAIILAILVVAGASAALAADATVAVLRLASTVQVRMPLRLAPPIACLTTVFLLSAAVRAGDAASATPPPMVRLAHPDPSGLDGPQASVLMPDGGTSAQTTYVVAPGDCLWRIARGVLAVHGRRAEGGAVADLWRSIYEANRAVIGPDPDLILPGQVLSIPEV